MGNDLRELRRELMPHAEYLVELARRAFPDRRVVVTSVVRSRAKQKRLYAAWLKRGMTGLPALPPGRSLHEHGIAFDLSVMHRGQRDDDALRQLGELWKSWGGQWGGDARVGYDPVHFQAKQLL